MPTPRSKAASEWLHRADAVKADGDTDPFFALEMGRGLATLAVAEALEQLVELAEPPCIRPEPPHAAEQFESFNDRLARVLRSPSGRRSR